MSRYHRASDALGGTRLAGFRSPENEEYYMGEACAHFALALHELHGYPLRILVDEGIGEDGMPTVAHVYAVDREGDAVDIRGHRSEEEVRGEFWDLAEPATYGVTPEELRRDWMGDDKPLHAPSESEVAEARAVILAEPAHDTSWPAPADPPPRSARSRDIPEPGATRAGLGPDPDAAGGRAARRAAADTVDIEAIASGGRPMRYHRAFRTVAMSDQGLYMSDETGEPLVAYHGSATDFAAFEPGHGSGWSAPRRGFYFADGSHAAGEFGSVVRAFNLRIRNPLDLRGEDSLSEYMSIAAGVPHLEDTLRDAGVETVHAAVSGGHAQSDDFVDAAALGGPTGLHFDSYVVFDPSQIVPIAPTWAGESARTASFPAEYPPAGDMVSGLRVTDDVPNTGSISASMTEYEILDGIREVPMSHFPGRKARSDRRGSSDLAKEIEENGWIDPLIVAIEADAVEKGPYILEGAHRLDALAELGKESFPALVVLDTYGSMPVADSGGDTRTSCHRASRIAAGDPEPGEQDPVRIVIVCRGNTCRSPMAEGMCRRMLAERGLSGAVEVDSAGTKDQPGKPASENAAKTVPGLEGHRARTFGPGDASADHVWAMTLDNLEAVLPAAPHAELLLGGEEVPNPFGGDMDAYASAASAIRRGLESRLDEIEREVAARVEPDHSCATCHGFGTTEDGKTCPDCPPDTPL